MPTSAPPPPDSDYQFHVLSFEGPDPYATVGDLGTRVEGLTETLAAQDYNTHLWFVGDPEASSHENRHGVELHRWCQWISAHHPHGVYDGELGKCNDYAASLPPYMLEATLLPHLRAGGRATVLAEEWQTAAALLHLDWLLRKADMRSQVTLAWNANSTYGFGLVDWSRLKSAATITTVSRYMKHLMRPYGVTPTIIPNGLTADAYLPPEPAGTQVIKHNLHSQGRLVLAKLGRFVPDKRWVESIRLMAQLKRLGWQPLMIARGGQEVLGRQIMQEAARLGLTVAQVHAPESIAGLMQITSDLANVDILELTTPLNAACRRALFKAADVVLANSAHEPFGFTGLEAMASGALTATGNTGEDYAIHGHNALVLQTGDPEEFLQQYAPLRANQDEALALRSAGEATARRYQWLDILHQRLLPRLSWA